MTVSALRGPLGICAAPHKHHYLCYSGSGAGYWCPTPSEGHQCRSVTLATPRASQPPTRRRHYNFVFDSDAERSRSGRGSCVVGKPTCPEALSAERRHLILCFTFLSVFPRTVSTQWRVQNLIPTTPRPKAVETHLPSGMGRILHDVGYRSDVSLSLIHI